MKRPKPWSIRFIYEERWRLYGSNGCPIGDFYTLKDARQRRKLLRTKPVKGKSK